MTKDRARSDVPSFNLEARRRKINGEQSSNRAALHVLLANRATGDFTPIAREQRLIYLSGTKRR
jgi:hypothetical protein